MEETTRIKLSQFYEVGVEMNTPRHAYLGTRYRKLCRITVTRGYDHRPRKRAGSRVSTRLHAPTIRGSRAPSYQSARRLFDFEIVLSLYFVSNARSFLNFPFQGSRATNFLNRALTVRLDLEKQDNFFFKISLSFKLNLRSLDSLRFSIPKFCSFEHKLILNIPLDICIFLLFSRIFECFFKCKYKFKVETSRIIFIEIIF